MLSKLDQQETALLAKFIGATKTFTGVVHCEITPSKDDTEAPISLFKVSPDGIYPDGDRCRVPEDLVSGTQGNQVWVKFNTHPSDQFAGIAHQAAGARSDPSGIVFRLPATTSIEILQNQVENNVSKTVGVAFDRRLVAQFGYVTAMPRSADVSTFQSTVKAALYSSTGAMQKLDFAGTPQGTGVVTGIADAAGTILDARAAAKKAAAAESDVLAQLERQRKILEEKAKIKELGGIPIDEQEP
jgi:hypothetical protein